MKKPGKTTSRAWLAAGVLHYSLVIALVVCALSFLLISMAFNERQVVNSFNFKIQARENCLSAMEILKSGDVAYDWQGELLDLYGKGRDSVWLWKKYWGLFEVNAARAIFRTAEHELSCIRGRRPARDYCLYLADNGNPLVVCGNNAINGNALLPKAGVKRGTISGYHYSGGSYVNGRIDQSSADVPAIPGEMLSQLNAWLDSDFSEDQIVVYKDLPERELDVPFTKEAVLVSSNSAVYLDGVRLSGNVILSSSKRIEVSSNAVVKNCLLIAPHIKVDAGFEGKLHLVCGDSCEIGKGSKLRYPSSISMIYDDNRSNPGFIYLDEQSLVQGGVLLYQEVPTLAAPKIIVSQTAHVDGLVYSNAMIQLEGSVHGQVVSRGFFLKTTSATYENHLLNSEIAVHELDSSFVFPLAVEGDDANQSVAAWLK